DQQFGRCAETEDGAITVLNFFDTAGLGEARHGGAADRVPRGLGVARALRIAGERPAYDEAVLRAGERDIEQAAMLAQGARFGDGAEPRAEVHIVRFRPGPDRRAVFRDEDAIAIRAMGRAGIRQDDDRRLKALGAVNSHYAHFVLRAR